MNFCFYHPKSNNFALCLSTLQHNWVSWQWNIDEGLGNIQPENFTENEIYADKTCQSKESVSLDDSFVTSKTYRGTYMLIISELCFSHVAQPNFHIQMKCHKSDRMKCWEKPAPFRALQMSWPFFLGGMFEIARFSAKKNFYWDSFQLLWKISIFYGWNKEMSPWKNAICGN